MPLSCGLTSCQRSSIILNMSGSLGQRILQARKAQRRTLRETAKAAMISPALLSLIEQDKHVPSRDVIVRLANLLNGDPDRWCGLAGRVTPELEARLARLANEEPEFFRKLVNKLGSRR